MTTTVAAVAGRGGYLCAPRIMPDARYKTVAAGKAGPNADVYQLTAY